MRSCKLSLTVGLLALAALFAAPGTSTVQASTLTSRARSLQGTYRYYTGYRHYGYYRPHHAAYYRPYHGGVYVKRVYYPRYGGYYVRGSYYRGYRPYHWRR
jgi:hypothetical protein